MSAESDTLNPDGSPRERRAPVIQPLGREHARTIGAMLGRAFYDNPGYQVLLSHLTPEARLPVVQRVKTGFTQATLRYGEVEGIWDGATLAAASMVFAPGQYPLGVGGFLWQATGCVLAGPRALRNFLRIDGYLTRHHPREPHYFLFVLGVEPDRQGRGLGKALLHSLNARADARGMPCYLETDKTSSVKLYESVGYRVVTDEVVPGLEPLRMWTMRREPGAGP